MLSSLMTRPKQESLLNIEDKQRARERVSKTEEIPSPVEAKLEKPIEKVTSSGGANTWSSLKIKLNDFQTRAPLLGMAIVNADGDSEKMFQNAKKLNDFHRATTEKIASVIWSDEKVPPAAIAVIGKGISDSMQAIWQSKIMGSQITPEKTASLFLKFMPEMKDDVEQIFSNDNNVPLATLIEAKTGVKIAAKLVQIVSNEPQSLQKFYLNTKSFSEVVAKLNEQIQLDSKQLSQTFSSPDERHRDIAYQSTLKTLGSVYEQSLQMAFDEIKTTIYSYKDKSAEEKQSYTNQAEQKVFGQLYDQTIENASQLASAIYSVKMPERQTQQADDAGPRPR